MLIGPCTCEGKYLDEQGALVKVPADLPRDLGDKVRKLSVAAFRALGCEGLARINFFLRDDGKLLVNEVNTLPGFTNISMYPKVMAAIGISCPELVDRLIRHALARADRTRMSEEGVCLAARGARGI